VDQPLKEPIRTAAESKREDGTCHPHQRRLFSRPKAIPTATRRLLAAEPKINECSSFEELHELIVNLLADVFGIGPLYCYDVAVRIGAYLHKLPEKVHLHAGPLNGAKLLGLSTDRGVLEVSELPEPLQGFEPFEIEDILCHFANAAKHTRQKARIC